MAINLTQLQSFDRGPLAQLDQSVGDALRHEHSERRRKLEEKRQRKLKKRKTRRRRANED